MNPVTGFLRRMSESKTALFGFGVLLFFAIMAVSVQFLPIPNPNSLNFQAFLPPSLAHPFGTDYLGRDVFSIVLWGSRAALAVGIISAGISAVIGIVVGAVAAYYGGWVDDVISRVVDVFLMIPVFFLILIVVAIFGGNIFYTMAIIGVTIWPSNARLMRAQILSLKEMTFVKALRSYGVGGFSILFRHLLPNGVAPVITNTMLQMGAAVLIEAGLSFLGLGDPRVVDWGRTIYLGEPYVALAWWISTIPGAFLALLVLGLNLLGDGLNQVFRPRMRGSK
jgi:peptide/nickel transport system permease protein